MSLTADRFIFVKVVRMMHISLETYGEAILALTCSQGRPFHFPTVLNFQEPSSTLQSRYLPVGLELLPFEVMKLSQRQVLPSCSSVSSTLISPLACVASLRQDLLLPSL
jgi:hypothetical protein